MLSHIGKFAVSLYIHKKVLLIFLNQPEQHVELVETTNYQEKHTNTQECVILTPVHLHHV